MKPPESLLEVYSLNGSVVAIVEQDASTCYFYLQSNKPAEPGVKSCWVRNLCAAPEQLDVSPMQEGVPPTLPRNFCRYLQGSVPLLGAALKVVWSEEGDAAALLENGEIIAVIPSWSGQDGFHGYARDCVGQSSLCWELGTPETNVQFERYKKAQDWWRSWEQEPGPWPKFREEMCRAVERGFGQHSNYYAIGRDKWPPKGMLRIPRGDTVLLITVGMSLQPQPTVELHFDDPAPHRRVELAISLDASLPEDKIKTIASYLGGQTSYPWSYHTFLGHGHTLPANTFAALSGGAFADALLLADPATAVPLDLPPYRGDPISLLWMTPISERERKFAEDKGSAKLAEKLREKGCDWKHRFERREVV
jgi:hypothetical protein